MFKVTKVSLLSYFVVVSSLYIFSKKILLFFYGYHIFLNYSQCLYLLVLLTVFRYVVFRFVLVEKTKSAKNIWEPVFENVIILGFLMADTSSKRQKHT